MKSQLHQTHVQILSSTQIPGCLGVIAKNKDYGKLRDRHKQTLVNRAKLSSTKFSNN